MDFRPSPAQQLLVSTARDFLRKRADDPPSWRAMAELGWPGLLVPPELGGSGGALLDVVLLVEEMARASTPGPFVASAVIATSLLLRAGRRDQQKRWLPAMASGERIVGAALLDDDDGTRDGHGPGLTLDPRGRLSGRTLFVEAADVADALIVAARNGRDVALLLIPTDRAGIARQPLDTITPERVYEVSFDDVVVNAPDRLAGGGDELAAAVAAGAVARTAEMVGAAQRVLELAVEHAKTRVQGGRPIGAYQAVQHTCADLVRDVDASRGLLYRAAWSLDTAADAVVDVAMAKAYAGEACLSVARRGHQVFGAIGYCDEHPLHRLHKRILAASLDGGDASRHLETVARAIGLV